MPTGLSKDTITDSLRKFKSRRDALLHEDISTFEQHLKRFLQFCRDDLLVRRALDPIEKQASIDIDAWWDQYKQSRGDLSLPPSEDEELLLRLCLLEQMEDDTRKVFQFGIVQSGRKRRDHVELVRSLLIRPLVEELGNRIGKEANLASPEAREVQAVPFDRIPAKGKTRIFLSHKSEDKAIARRYHKVLKELGFDPWLDERDLTAGKNLERSLLEGFKSACAVVFFITENFEDENYLATEVEYAVIEKRKKQEQFEIITLVYPNATNVPELLERFVYKEVENDLTGLYEVIRALPVELGQVRWKEHAV